ncbi:MAG TPA: folylpolyglutamate synthase/dihydrofolate synthase family protein [Ramlibacter sp.]|jgi:dihydrofolate synthase/folylpolyglutamate synthase|uniref:bifunctional folylpolyglutamate synthase/dihydrofolate synthase n=1 Tax=Ramlibacter sp. TaxID=1917967 RepID=UPI002D5088BC|nr:folylpolyglutamate synthase/dihydrofolate synthase family protein [Ramlibacter sp.]HZY19099.1 folylpolyglutamate synthase/dihydrofolate synthase family protein [Ramlibacter sp.]
MSQLHDWERIRATYDPGQIKPGLDRLHACLARMGRRLFGSTVVITVAGTNGKGSTCAMLESVLRHAGYRTGLYTSPHLVDFRERVRLGEALVDHAALDEAYAAVHRHAGECGLTLFEVDTLACLLVLDAAALDVAILEVGMGGRLDAVNVVDADCAVITSIDLDHQEFLGPDREAIGREKAGILRPGRPAVVSDPVPPASIVQAADALGVDLWLLGRDYNFSGDKQQWGWAGRGRRYAGLGYPGLRGANQLLNASGVLAALTALRDRIPVTAQAVRLGLSMVELPGRFQIVPGQPALVLDVAHNPHSVAALAANLDAMGFYPTTHAVFGAMGDKDLGAMLRKMDPLVDRWCFTDLPTPRAAAAGSLQALWQSLTARKDATSSVHASPEDALREAVAAADPTDRILVFGSFYTVGGVLKDGLPRLQARHLGS